MCRKALKYTEEMIDKQKGYQAGNNMREIIRDNKLLLPVLSRFDIAFGFGETRVSEICEENGVDTDTFLTVCNFLSNYPYDISAVSLDSLIAYLKHAHKSFLEITLPRIRLYLIEAINHSDTNEVALLLIKFYDDYVSEVRKHMDYENDVIFEYVSRLSSGISDNDFRISDFSVNHGHMASKLNELKDLFIYHYKQKNNDRLSAVLYDIIVCEQDMMSHFEVESRLFIPAVEILEKDVIESEQTGIAELQTKSEDVSDLSLLSEREKDIVRCVAQGKSNKETADELFISTHTVATHRRNISAKLDIHSSAGLTIFAIIHNLVNLSEVRPQ